MDDKGGAPNPPHAAPATGRAGPPTPRSERAGPPTPRRGTSSHVTNPRGGQAGQAPQVVSQATSQATSTNRPSSPSIGEVGSVLAGRYEVSRELGRGGMGVVYLCHDLVSGERVALKRLRPPDDSKGPRPEE